MGEARFKREALKAISQRHNPSGAPHVRFDGNQAGLAIGKSGDTSSLFDYSLICGCGAFLGVLGGFKPNASGERTCYCPKCKHAIGVSKTAQILFYNPHDITKTA